ncbi:MAG: ectonucleotide pyrophosphatase/phosphodiesterase [Gemmatimonadaceae bacterium]
MTVRGNSVRATILLAVVALVVACTPPSSARRSARSDVASRPYVVLVSLDAFRYDFIERYRPAALERLAARGVAARALIPPFPSKTFPSHYTIATGLYPGHHGILANTFYDPAFGGWFRVKDSTTVRDGRWYGGTPIWVAAEREGVRTSVYFWPGSESAVQGLRPSAWWSYRASVPDSVRVDASIAQLRLPVERRPHLVMLYLTDVDDTTHKFGPDTPHTAAAVASIDRAVSRLLDANARLPQRDSVNVIVLSDHGIEASAQEKMLPLRPLLAAAGIDTLRVQMGDNGPTMSLWFGGDTALAHRALGALAAGLVHARAYARGATPARWHVNGNARGGEVLVVAEPGYVVAKSAGDRLLDRGNHGWDPSDPLMLGIFVAAGPQISASGAIPSFESVHVYPFLTSLLRLARAPRTDGDPAVLAPYLRADR